MTIVCQTPCKRCPQNRVLVARSLYCVQRIVGVPTTSVYPLDDVRLPVDDSRLPLGYLIYPPALINFLLNCRSVN
jgi:hypothetical protein